MKTVTVKLGGKNYLAAQLTISGFSDVTRIVAAMNQAGRDRDLSKVNGLLRELTEIACNSIRRAGSKITVEELCEIAQPEEIAEAVGILIHLENSSGFRAVNQRIN